MKERKLKMKRCNGMLGALLLLMFVASSCASVKPRVVEPVIEQEEEEDSLQEWWEIQDLDLYRPWRGMDESMDPFKK